MINEIRSYFKSIVNEIDSDYKQHDQYYTSANIPDSNIECTYFLKIGDFISSRIDTNYDGSFDVTLELWKNGGNEVIETLDKAYCDAIEIANECQQQVRLDQTEFMKSIISSGITNEAVESNDNAGKFTIQFVVRVAYN